MTNGYREIAQYTEQETISLNKGGDHYEQPSHGYVAVITTA